MVKYNPLKPERSNFEMEEIRIHPDPILTKKAKPVETIDGKVKDIADRRAEVMYAKKGIGLAAPQIGIPSRILIVDLGGVRRVLINPEVIEEEGESIMEEGCLSLPNIGVQVRRKDRVLIRGWDLECKEIHLELFGFESRVYQHEIDHLNGILMIHHLPRIKRELLVKRMLKSLKRFKEEEPL